MPLNYKTKNYDLLGMSAALLCLVHCVVLPLLVFIPIGISHNPYIDLLFLLIGAWSVYKTSKRSKRTSVKYMLWAGLLLITISIAMDIFLHLHSPLMYVGVAVLVAGHVLNMRTHHQSKQMRPQQEARHEK
ncbi:MAG: hypothetical protein BGO31_11595 [Bacteroidetes bacterium 43-16]|nr:MAG: hypothetical protein BGO31_11595 [Bacteroidetes bacterium 43-16]